MHHKVVLASGNVGKIREFTHFFTDCFHLMPQADFAVTPAIENGMTFVENALIKARHAAKQTQHPALADDSGLVVPALGGAPGIYSARFGGPDLDAIGRMQHLLESWEASGSDDRRAYFYACLVYVRHADDPAPLIADGLWWGELNDHAAGDGGFGYDPIFYVPALQCTAAQLSLVDKQKLSHRGQAMTVMRGLWESRV